jgi:hypothetical protein
MYRQVLWAKLQHGVGLDHLAWQAILLQWRCPDERVAESVTFYNA